MASKVTSLPRTLRPFVSSLSSVFGFPSHVHPFALPVSFCHIYSHSVFFTFPFVAFYPFRSLLHLLSVFQSSIYAPISFCHIYSLPVFVTFPCVVFFPSPVSSTFSPYSNSMFVSLASIVLVLSAPGFLRLVCSIFRSKNLSVLRCSVFY